MHTVHRIISSSLHLSDLLPRLTRFTFQVLKANYCAMFLLDGEKKYLEKRFETGDIPRSGSLAHKRISAGRGIVGKMVTNGDFLFSRKTMAVPLIDDDVFGIIVAKCNGDERVFSKVDLEILRTVSEQAVVAIKNAQLFEHHERMTTGSVKSIANIMELNVHNETLLSAELFDKLVCEIGIALHLSDTEQRNIMLAAKLLDMGHLGIPEHIRLKQGSLTEEEQTIIRNHPFKAVEIIQSIESLQTITPIILYHHERYDGKGYPHGLKGEEIPLPARILSVVMIFTAMVAPRPYRKEKSIKAALAELRACSGSHCDPHVVNVFLRIIKRRDIAKMLGRCIQHTQRNNRRGHTLHGTSHRFIKEE